MEMEELVSLSVKHNVSDLHLCSAWPARWRRHGVLEPVPGSANITVRVDNGTRRRANAFQQHYGLSLVLRLLPTRLQVSQGIILVMGATGSGKSTTLAAMVNRLNQTFCGHILTLEDPIEFVHAPASCLIQHSEVGIHCRTFTDGLRAALREDPDVILLGELRDIETIRLALTAAETGHLILTTLHTRGAAQAVERLIDVFPAAEKNLVRTQPAVSLNAVLAQKLVPSTNGGRVALYELLINTPAVASLIREGKTHQLPGMLQTGQQAGMQDFALSLAHRCQQEKVTPAAFSRTFSVLKRAYVPCRPASGAVHIEYGGFALESGGQPCCPK